MTKAYQERLIALIKDTVTLLCKNGLEYSQEFCVEGLLGVTLDKDEVFLIPIKELVNDKGVGTTDGDDELYTSHADVSGDGMSPKRERKKKRRHTEPAAAYDSSAGNYDSGAGEWESNTRDRTKEENQDANNVDDQPASKRSHDDTKGDLNKVKAEDIVVIKEEVDDEEFVSAFQDSSMDSSNLNRTEQGESGMAYYSQPGPSQNVSGMGFSMDQLAENSALSVTVTGMQQGSEGDASSWLQQSQGNVQNTQGDWQGQKHQVVCVPCNKVFSNPRLLRRHWKSVHQKLSFHCPLCDRMYNRKDNLTAHMKLKHRFNQRLPSANRLPRTAPHSDALT